MSSAISRSVQKLRLALRKFAGRHDGSYHGFVRDAAGNITQFDYPGTTNNTIPLAINSVGSVTGYVARISQYGFVRDSSGRFTLIAATDSACETIAGRANCTMPAGINGAGEVTGFSYQKVQGEAFGFTYSPQTGIEQFRAPGAGHFFGTGTFPARINERRSFRAGTGCRDV